MTSSARSKIVIASMLALALRMSGVHVHASHDGSDVPTGVHVPIFGMHHHDPYPHEHADHVDSSRDGCAADEISLDVPAIKPALGDPKDTAFFPTAMAPALLASSLSPAVIRVQPSIVLPFAVGHLRPPLRGPPA